MSNKGHDDLSTGKQAATVDGIVGEIAGDFIIRRKKQGTLTTIMTSHNEKLAEMLADVLHVMRNG